ncbi:hypothetical protein ADUPG1_013435, partial [Aduncisulcus paluster]
MSESYKPEGLCSEIISQALAAVDDMIRDASLNEGGRAKLHAQKIPQLIQTCYSQFELEQQQHSTKSLDYAIKQETLKKQESPDSKQFVQFIKSVYSDSELDVEYFYKLGECPSLSKGISFFTYKLLSSDFYAKNTFTVRFNTLLQVLQNTLESFSKIARSEVDSIMAKYEEKGKKSKKSGATDGSQDPVITTAAEEAVSLYSDTDTLAELLGADGSEDDMFSPATPMILDSMESSNSMLREIKKTLFAKSKNGILYQTKICVRSTIIETGNKLYSIFGEKLFHPYAEPLIRAKRAKDMAVYEERRKQEEIWKKEKKFFQPSLKPEAFEPRHVREDVMTDICNAIEMVLFNKTSLNKVIEECYR